MSELAASSGKSGGIVERAPELNGAKRRQTPALIHLSYILRLGISRVTLRKKYAPWTEAAAAQFFSLSLDSPSL